MFDYFDINGPPHAEWTLAGLSRMEKGIFDDDWPSHDEVEVLAEEWTGWGCVPAAALLFGRLP